MPPDLIPSPSTALAVLNDPTLTDDVKVALCRPLLRALVAAEGARRSRRKMHRLLRGFAQGLPDSGEGGDR